MNLDQRHGLGSCVVPPSSSSTILLQGLVQALVADAIAGLEERVRAIVREELRRGRATEAEWISSSQAAALAGVSPATIRRWRTEGKLTKAQRGRVNVAELRALMARGDDAPAVPSDFAAARAKRIAGQLRGPKGGPA